MGDAAAAEHRLRRLLDDFAAEAADLDGFVSALDERSWLTPTPAEGWDVRDSIAHLALGDEIAYDVATTGRSEVMEEASLALARGPVELAAFERRLVGRGRAMSPSAVLDWWRASNADLRAALCDLEPAARLAWGPNRMSVASFTTARIMETWAHGVDCFDGIGVEPPYTDRLRHVAFLGLAALPHAFARAGLAAPGAVRLELTSPCGEPWSLGPADARTTVRGTAVDWCRVATRRDRSGEPAKLHATGPDGPSVVAHVQAYL